MPSSTKPASRASLKTSVKSSIRAGIERLPDPLDIARFIILDYRRAFGRYPNILFPKTFNEKVQVRKLFDRRPQISLWADKYAAREYARKKLGPGVLPTLYHATVEPANIPFDKLPRKFVAKATHGSGWVYIVRNKDAVNRQEIIAQCRKWMATSYFQLTKEWAYKTVKRRILVEEFLDPGTGADPYDYKFYVFGGRARFVQVDVDRHTCHKRNFYDTRWNRIDCRMGYDNCAARIAKPGKLDVMIDFAQRLSDNIDFVRVDLYEVRGKVYFGEMTTTPANGLKKFAPAWWDKAFGDLWQMHVR